MKSLPEVIRLIAALLFASLFASEANAYELRAGAMAHNVGARSDEGGINIQVALTGRPMRQLRWAAQPRPYAMISANLQGDTSYIAAGAEWRLRPSERWTIEPSFGAALHDGALKSPYDSGDPRAESFAQRHQLLGTRVLFRSSLAITRRLSNSTTVGLIYEHLSNGGELFGQSENESLNELGIFVRLTTG